MVWSMLKDITPTMFNGFGGVNVEAIRYGIRLYRFPRWREHEVFLKATTYAELFLKQAEKDA